jgi:hypothetical protein
VVIAIVVVPDEEDVSNVDVCPDADDEDVDEGELAILLRKPKTRGKR